MEFFFLFLLKNRKIVFVDNCSWNQTTLYTKYILGIGNCNFQQSQNKEKKINRNSNNNYKKKFKNSKKKFA